MPTIFECLIAIEMFGLRIDSVVMDIGGGSPAIGLSFRLIAQLGVHLIVVDSILD